MKHIHITTGDVNGIGLEVSLKALVSLNIPVGIRFYLWRNKNIPSFLNKEWSLLYSRFSCIQQEGFSFKKREPRINLVEVVSSKPPAEWVKQAGLLCLKNKESSALVTGPLSKIQMQRSGFAFKGHTDMLKHITEASQLFMCFLGDKFNVVLLTDHQALGDVKITQLLLEEGLQQALKFRKYLSEKKKPIGVLGLNPHAGEEGVLGQEEKLIFKPVLEKYSKKEVIGPLTPDIAFDSDHWEKYSLYLCAYHDQGLIPFKMVHSRKGVHTTLGLPFVRTSVDHGTAQDICGKNKADCSSMKKAIEQAVFFLNHHQ